jgi:Cu(I)/Ag(I) efflux system membrane fusion protein
MTEHTSSPAGRQDREGPSPFESSPPTPLGTARRIAFLVVAIGAAVAAAWWFTRAGRAAGAPPRAGTVADSNGSPVMLTPEAANRIGVTYATVERGSLTADVRTVGLVTYDETRVKTIAPKVDGYVEQLFVAYTGQPVEVNDSLLRIYSPMLVTAQEELLLAKKLATDVSGGSPEAVRNAESLLSSARHRLKYWDIPDEDIARVERTGEVQRTLTLRSPLRGVVVQKNVSAGGRIMAGDAVYQVADLSEVWLEGEVFERDLAAIRAGETVTAQFAAMPGKQREGRIAYVSPTISGETRTTKIRVVLPNADFVLKPGMYAAIQIRGTARHDVLSVPRSAVLATGTRVLVFVKGADGTLTPREVELGGNTDDRVEVLRGLSAGETVVSSATFLIDAESNLGSALGGMANMPGMDVSPPKSAAQPAPPVAKPPAARRPDPMANMPGMGAPAKKP